MPLFFELGPWGDRSLADNTVLEERDRNAVRLHARRCGQVESKGLCRLCAFRESTGPVSLKGLWHQATPSANRDLHKFYSKQSSIPRSLASTCPLRPKFHFAVVSQQLHRALHSEIQIAAACFSCCSSESEITNGRPSGYTWSFLPAPAGAKNREIWSVKVLHPVFLWGFAGSIDPCPPRAEEICGEKFANDMEICAEKLTAGLSTENYSPEAGDR